MSIEDVIKQDEERLEEEISSLETEVKNWIVEMVKTVEEERQAFPDSVSCGFGEDLAINILLTLKDFEFEQLETLQKLSSKIEELGHMKNDDERFGRFLVR